MRGGAQSTQKVRECPRSTNQPPPFRHTNDFFFVVFFLWKRAMQQLSRSDQSHTQHLPFVFIALSFAGVGEKHSKESRSTVSISHLFFLHAGFFCFFAIYHLIFTPRIGA